MNYNVKVLLGFSGGIDSTAAALYLRDSGYEVLLETLDTTGDLQFLENARRTAENIGLQLHFSDVRDEFRRSVIDYFTDGYLKGHTPAPCTVCNSAIKWKTLFRRAVETGARHIATGHYFRIARSGGLYFVRRGADPVKDQSYYLWQLSQEILSMALTPMGEKIKSEVKRESGFLPDAAESMGVCFLKGIDYGDFMLRSCKDIVPGSMVDLSGRMVGTHRGCALYTIGQKKGLDCPLPGAVVTGIDAARNLITVGKDKDLYSDKLSLRDCVAPDMDRLLSSDRITVMVRGLGRNPKGYAKVTRCGQGLDVELSDPAWAAAPGQPVVMYEDDMVLGGGFLDRAY